MTLRGRRPRERLNIGEWPSAIAQAWRQATTVAPLFDDDGGAAHWSVVTHRGVELGLGLYLGFLTTMGILRSEDSPTSISARTLLSAYHEHCRQRGLSAASMVTRFNMLNEAVRVMAPRLDRSDVIKLLRRLQWTARRQRKKSEPGISASDLYAAGIGRMKRVEVTAYEKRDVQAVQYGDGLMMAMHAAKPVRISTFARMSVGQHLRKVGERYVLAFAPTETKNGEPVHVELPTSLTIFIDRWLEVFRPMLLKGGATEAMWISCYRDRMAVPIIHARFCAACLAELGIRINPHMVRSIVATSVAVSMPHEARIIPSLLDHRGDAVARRHYILADGLSASAQYLERLEARRRAATAAISKRRHMR